MNKYLYKTRLVILFVVAAACFFQACGSGGTKEDISSLEAQRTDFINAANSRINEEAAGVTLNQIRETEGNILIAVDYPSYSANEQISAQISEYINDIVDEFKSEAQSMGEPTDETGLFTLNITYKTNETDDGIIGFKFVENMYSGKTKRNNYITGMSFDKTSGVKVDISRFFNPSTSYLNTIADTVRDYINRNNYLGDNKNEELFKEGTAPNLQNYSNFVEAPGHKFIFYFNEGQIADPEAGTIQAIIPMAELKNVLNAELKEIYNPTPLPQGAQTAPPDPSSASEPQTSDVPQTSESSFAPLESVNPQ